jgi:predicted phage-related endonuclease
MTHDAQWYTDRLLGIGGSEVGDIYNMDYGCARRLGYIKTKAEPDYTKEETAAMERGTIMEVAARMMYEKRTGRKVESKDSMAHKDYPYMRVSVDGMTASPTKAGEGVVEFKVVNRFVFSKFKKGGLREGYILQLQHGMYVTGALWGSFGILCPEPWQFEWFDVDADPALQAKIRMDEDIFWQSVKRNELYPPLANLNDKRCATCEFRQKCRGSEFVAQISQDDAREVLARPELQSLVEECVELNELKSEASALEEEARAKLKKEIGEAYGIRVAGFRALLPKWEEERWDTKSLNSAEEDAKRVIDKFFSVEEELTGVALDICRVMIKFLKCRKPPTPKSSMRIYPTGD